jgi:peptidyl-Asp metalloendopeptidase
MRSRDIRARHTPWRDMGFRIGATAASLAVALLILAATSATGLAATADAVPSLFDAAPAQTSDAGESRADAALRRRHVNGRIDALVRADGLPRVRAGERIGLNLFDDASFTATITRVSQQSPTSHTWEGKVDGMEHGYALLAVRDSALVGYVLVPGAAYRIGYTATGQAIVEQVDTGALPRESAPVIPPLGPVSAARVPDAAPDAAPLIDVMVMYTPAARVAAGGKAAIEAEVSLAVASANQAYANSALAQRLRLVSTGEIGIVESGDFDTDLTAFQNSATVSALRQASGADIVSLLTSNGPNPPSCGLGFLLTVNTTAFAPFAFSVVDRLCASGNLSFAHELGHNMGAHHDPYVAGTDKTLFPYSHGYVDLPGRIRTIMAYNDQCAASGFNCTRLPYFSTPAFTVGGRPIGNATTSNNASTLAQTASTVASFLQAVSVSLSASITPATVGPGQTLSGSIGLNNPGLTGAADLFVGMLLPDGATVAFFINGGVAMGSLADFTSFQPLAAGVSLAAPFSASVPGFFSYTWSGSEPHGGYTFFFLATKAGAVTDGTLSGDEILGVAAAPFLYP